MKIKDIFDTDPPDTELYEMANVTARYHGIPGVVIWVGMENKRHGLRVKVSNIKDRFSFDDCFTIQMPSLQYDHTAVARWITPHVMQQIISWIKLNQQLLHDYETGIIVDTGDFLQGLSRI